MKNEKAEAYVTVMKRDWDERARQDARWYINTLRRQQSDEEFDQTGVVEVERLVLADLPLLTRGRDPRGLRVLEIGCGAGRMTRHLAATFGEIVGIDVSGEMIRQARERLSCLGNVQLLETSGIDFAPFPNEHFDLILSVYVFQHVPSADVIESNILDALRVLAPEGVFKFQTNGIASSEFEQVEKNTWSGASFPEEKIRQLARESEAQLMCIFGAGTQYCWTMIRKRVKRRSARQRPRIEFFGRTEDALNKRIPIGGDQASLTVISSGLDHNDADCNSVRIEINGQSIPARYVGSIGRNFEPALRSLFADSLDELTQIEIGLPAGMKTGRASARVMVDNAAMSEPVGIEFEEARTSQPKIGAIMNTFDDGLEIHAHGAKSRMRILVEGLDSSANVENVRVQIGDKMITPVYVGFLSKNAVYEVEAHLSEDAVPEMTFAQIHFGDRQSQKVRLEIK